MYVIDLEKHFSSSCYMQFKLANFCHKKGQDLVIRAKQFLYQKVRLNTPVLDNLHAQLQKDCQES